MEISLRGDRKKSPTKYKFRNITKEEILALEYGNHVEMVGYDHRVGTVKVNGKVRTWKHDSNRVEVPFKDGMYEYFTLSLEECLRRLVVRMED